MQYSTPSHFGPQVHFLQRLENQIGSVPNSLLKIIVKYSFIKFYGICKGNCGGRITAELLWHGSGPDNGIKGGKQRDGRRKDR